MYLGVHSRKALLIELEVVSKIGAAPQLQSAACWDWSMPISR
jgi:hypothetical protein